jgi:hypothetical protein
LLAHIALDGIIPPMTDKEISKTDAEILEERADLARTETERSKKDLERLLRIFDMVGFHDFMEYLASPRRILLWNFIAGMAKGFGIVVGMTLVVALLVWVLTKMVDFPLIGEYFQKILELVDSAAPGSVPSL